MKFNKKIKSLLFFILTVLCFENAFALCMDGRHPTVQEELISSDYVFIGRIEKSKDIASADDPTGIDRIEYDVRVEKLFKGRATKIIKIISENTSSRFVMVPNETYLLFVVGSKKNGLVDSCGNSGESTLRSPEILTLKSLSKK
jgi:hypothetical protein